MIKKIKESMRKNTVNWCVITIFIIVLSVLAFVYLSSDKRIEFVFSEHLDETAFEINGECITLKYAAYYLMVIETNVNEAALEYNADNPIEYWNLYLNDGKEESNFLRTQAKQDAMDACIRDVIYYNEALTEGIVLDRSEEKECSKDAYEQERLLTGKQVNVTEYDNSDLYDAIRRTAIIKKYMTKLMDEGYSEEELDVGGEYYQKIKEQYDVKVNDDLWEKITLGELTIN